MPIDRLPAQYQPTAYRLRDFLVTDAALLLIIGITTTARAFSYLSFGSPPSSTHPAERLAPMAVWGYVWLAIGVVAILASFRHDSPIAALSVGLGVAINALWGFSFLISTFTGDSPRGWVSSLSYFCIAVTWFWAMWRGSRTEVRIREAPPNAATH